MRAKSEIFETLADRLSGSDVWKKLKNALLGRELLAFGAEVIYETESVKDTMLLQLNVETADIDGLYLLSQMNEIPITGKKPSSVVVEMMPGTKTYAPFELAYSVGNVSFTNTEYTIQGKTVSLINGTHKCYATEGMSVSAGAVAYGETVWIYDNGASVSHIKLGNAYPDSIVMVGENGVEIPRYSAEIALSNNIDVMYKVVTFANGDIYIRFVLGDNVTAPTVFKIDWLDHDCMEFEVEDDSVKVNNETVAVVKYVSQGAEDDVEYMRLQLKKEMAKYNGFNTPKSIEQYVKGLPYILDAKCERSQDGINIYVKPSSYLDLNTYLDFSEIAAHVSLNSILFPNVKVRTGNQIRFGVEISGIDDAKLQNGIKSLLQDKFSYENMTFNSIVNVGSILSEIYGKYGVVPTINMTIQEAFVQDKPLSFKPIKNSLKMYNVGDSVVAWEENGLLYGMADTTSDIPLYMFTMVGCIGTTFLLMQEGKREDGTITYSSTKNNKFYLYDASTNVIKAFDGCMQNLLYTESNPDLKYTAWNQENMTLGEVYDVNFLSTNNALVIQFVFKNNGVDELNDDPSTGTYTYWDKNNTAYYNNYKNHAYDELESNPEYQGKYQTVFFINNPLALKNPNYDSWQVFCDNANGDVNVTKGFYTGLRNKMENKVQLDVKSNWFVHNGKSYYAYSITDKYVYITNGAKNLAVSVSGSFLGMMPYENDLYVVSEKYITKVEGFEGLKEKEVLYQIYRDFNTPMPLSAIMREFDNQIAFKTSANEVYTATGFEIIDGNKMGFQNLKQVFVDMDIEEDMKLGGCTKDFVTMYKLTVEDEQTGYTYYCYDINAGRTMKRDKTTDFSTTGNTETSEEEQTSYINLATFFGTNPDVASFSDYPTDLGTLVYFTSTSADSKHTVENKDNLFFIQGQGTAERNKCLVLCVDNVDDKAYPVYLERSGHGIDHISATENMWSYDGNGDKIDTDFIAGFYKLAMLSVPTGEWENESPTTEVTRTEENGVLTITTDKTEINVKPNLYENENGESVTVNACYKMPTAPLVSIVVQKGKGNSQLMNKATTYTGHNPIYFKEQIAGFSGTINDGTGDHVSYKLNIARFYKKTTTIYTTSTEYADAAPSKELVTIGYFDENKNSCINDRGSEIAYVRYYTQNPNVASNSYLVLDENEIKFI